MANPGPHVDLVSLRTADGVLLQGVLAGPADAEAAVLAVHGACGNFYSGPPAALLAAAPARGLRVLSANLRSHDLGSLGDGEPCIGFVRSRFLHGLLDLDAALAFLLERGVRRVVVVAHSYGGVLALRWLGERSPAEVVGAAVASAGAGIRDTAHWFVDAPLDHVRALAAAAVAAGEPHRLLALSSSAPMPTTVEAATLLDLWGRDDTLAAATYATGLRLPLLVVAGRKEPPVYRERAAEAAAAAADGEYLLLDADHYYAEDPAAFAEAVLGWCERRDLLRRPR